MLRRDPHHSCETSRCPDANASRDPRCTRRRSLLRAIGALAMIAPSTLLRARVAMAADATLPPIEVYKTPGCQCCEKWMDHLRDAGFQVHAQDGKLNAMRRQLGIPGKLIGCHTAVVGDYVVEGHVPAAQIKRLLRDKPQVAGISVPGMPVGSPGMEGPGGKPYDVLSWRKSGEVEVFSHETPLDN